MKTGLETGSRWRCDWRLRACEWALIAFFLYVAGISPFFRLRSARHAVPFLIAGAITTLIVFVAWLRSSYVRDWVALALVFVAYREMEWFTPKQLDYHFERYWIGWDRALLHGSGLQRGIEGAGPLLPGLLELSYLLVYAVGPFTVAMLYAYRCRKKLGGVLFVYVAGTVGAYALFPYFPSSPPWTVFPGMDMPGITTALRRINLLLVGGYGIHSSVFPSAHVSSAFSAAWGLLIFLPERKAPGLWMAGYAALVALATVYGRYHYGADALAGLGISLCAAGLGLVLKARGGQ